MLSAEFTANKRRGTQSRCDQHESAANKNLSGRPSPQLEDGNLDGVCRLVLAQVIPADSMGKAICELNEGYILKNARGYEVATYLSHLPEMLQLAAVGTRSQEPGARRWKGPTITKAGYVLILYSVFFYS
jgi:hypothetical protein